jgi:hypothetical protein
MRTLALLAACAVLAAGCADGDTGSTLTDGLLSVAPGAVDFGEVTLGDDATAEVVISNLADGETAITLSYAGDDAFTASPLGPTSVGDESVTVTITFAPTIAGVVSGVLTIDSVRSTEVPVTGTGL